MSETTAGELVQSMEKGTREGGVVLRNVRDVPGRWLVTGTRDSDDDGVRLFLRSLTDGEARGAWVAFTRDERLTVIPAPPLAEMTGIRHDSVILRRAASQGNARSKDMGEAMARRAYLVTAEVPANDRDLLDTIVPGAIRSRFGGTPVKVTVQAQAWDGQPSYQAATRYAVTAQLRTHGTDSAGEYEGSRQLPYFELNGVVHGLRDEAHALDVARAILGPLGIHGDDLHICAVALPGQ